MLKLKPALQDSRKSRTPAWGGASLVNCFAEKADGDRRDDFAIMATPGLVEWADVGTGPVRGWQVVGGVLYVVSGNSLYSVNSSGNAVDLGAIPGSGPVAIASNYTELCIAADGTGYVYSNAALETPVPFDVSDVVYADGYIIWSIDQSEQIIISGLDDALTYDAADISSVEGNPDNIIGIEWDHRELHAFGSESTEVLYNSGATDFPFVRQGNAFIERGCFDRDSIVKIDNTIIFVGDDRIVYTFSGYQPQRISTHHVEVDYLQSASYARAFTYTFEGHKFYILETDTGTMAYDIATGAWHRRHSRGSEFWRCRDAIDAYGMLLLADRADGRLYTHSSTVHAEAGDPIEMEVILPAIESDRDYLTMYSFEVTIEAGVGNSSATDPQVMMTYSDDGGHHWSNELWRTMGRVGEYRTRAIWRKLGRFRNRQIKLRITDSARRLIIAYWADIQ